METQLTAEKNPTTVNFWCWTDWVRKVQCVIWFYLKKKNCQLPDVLPVRIYLCSRSPHLCQLLWLSQGSYCIQHSRNILSYAMTVKKKKKKNRIIHASICPVMLNRAHVCCVFSLTLPAEITFSLKYTDFPQRAHLSAPPNLWADDILLEGRRQNHLKRHLKNNNGTITTLSACND